MPHSIEEELIDLIMVVNMDCCEEEMYRRAGPIEDCESLSEWQKVLLTEHATLLELHLIQTLRLPSPWLLSPAPEF